MVARLSAQSGIDFQELLHWFLQVDILSKEKRHSADLSGVLHEAQLYYIVQIAYETWLE